MIPQPTIPQIAHAPAGNGIPNLYTLASRREGRRRTHRWADLEELLVEELRYAAAFDGTLRLYGFASL